MAKPHAASRSPPSEQLNRLDSVLQLYAGDQWTSGLEGLKEAFTTANTNSSATPPMDPIVAALVGSLLYGKEQQQILLVHCLLHREPDALALHNSLVAREMQQRADGPGDNFVADKDECSLPIPPFPVSNALLFADPTFDCLSGLGTEPGTAWQDAVVLSTPFWLPRTGKLHKPVNISDGISPLVAASIRFNPDRELSIDSERFSPERPLDDATKDALAIARRLRVPSGFPSTSLPALLQLMPGLTAVHLATAKQLTAGMPALRSLEGLQELHITNCSDQPDLSVLAALPSLHALHLGGCYNVKDASALASLTSLQKLSLRCCRRGIDLSAIDALQTLHARIEHADHNPWEYDEYAMPHQVPVELLGTYADFMRSDDPEENIQGAFMIRKMLNHVDDELVGDAASAFANLTESTDLVDLVLDTGCLPRLVELLSANRGVMIHPAIRTIANIVHGNECRTQAVIDAGALPAFSFLLNHPKRSIRKEVCWTISNITAGTPDSIQAVIDADLIPVLMNATKHRELEVKKGASRSIANTIVHGSDAQIHSLVQLGVLPCLSGLLSVGNTEIVSSALEAIERILRVGEQLRSENQLKSNPYADEVVKCSEKESLLILQRDPTFDFCHLAAPIVEVHF